MATDGLLYVARSMQNLSTGFGNLSRAASSIAEEHRRATYNQELLNAKKDFDNFNFDFMQNNLYRHNTEIDPNPVSYWQNITNVYQQRAEEWYEDRVESFTTDEARYAFEKQYWDYVTAQRGKIAELAMKSDVGYKQADYQAQVQHAVNTKDMDGLKEITMSVSPMVVTPGKARDNYINGLYEIQKDIFIESAEEKAEDVGYHEVIEWLETADLTFFDDDGNEYSITDEDRGKMMRYLDGKRAIKERRELEELKEREQAATDQLYERFYNTKDLTEYEIWNGEELKNAPNNVKEHFTTRLRDMEEAALMEWERRAKERTRAEQEEFEREKNAFLIDLNYEIEKGTLPADELDAIVTEGKKAGYIDADDKTWYNLVDSKIEEPVMDGVDDLFSNADLTPEDRYRVRQDFLEQLKQKRYLPDGTLNPEKPSNEDIMQMAKNVLLPVAVKRVREAAIEKNTFDAGRIDRAEELNLLVNRGGLYGTVLPETIKLLSLGVRDEEEIKKILTGQREGQQLSRREETIIENNLQIINLARQYETMFTEYFGYEPVSVGVDETGLPVLKDAHNRTWTLIVDETLGDERWNVWTEYGWAEKSPVEWTAGGKKQETPPSESGETESVPYSIPPNVPGTSRGYSPGPRPKRSTEGKSFTTTGIPGVR